MSIDHHRLAEITAQLTAPFPIGVVEAKPIATTADDTRGLASLHVDVRHYQHRLDSVVGPAHWQVAHTPAARGMVCELTICGITKSDVGDYPLDPANPHGMTSSAAQAFKRACVQFGLGRYLYEFGNHWFPYDAERKRFCDPWIVVRQLYLSAGLPVDPDTPPTIAEVAQITVAPPPVPDVTSNQAGMILFLLGQRRQAHDQTAIAHVAASFEIPDLVHCTNRDDVLALALNKRNASLLIDQLKGATPAA